MSDWIEHNGGPQPVADGTWVVMDKVGFGSGFATAWQPAWLNWNKPNSYRIINQHLIDAARLEGVRLGLKAAAKVAAEKVEKRVKLPCPDGVEGCLAFHFRREYRDKSVPHIVHEIRSLNPDTIAKEAQHD